MYRFKTPIPLVAKLHTRPCCSYALGDLIMLFSLSLQSTHFHSDCYLGTINLGTSAMLPLSSWRSPEVGVTLLDSRTNSVEDLIIHE